MSMDDFRIAKVQATLRWFEDDIPLMNVRVKELSTERQESARRFAAAVIKQMQAELQRLKEEKAAQPDDSVGTASEPAD